MSALHSQGARAVQHLAALSAVTSRVGDIAALACDMLVELEGCQGASLYTTLGSSALVLRAATGSADPALRVQHVQLSDQGPIGQCARRRETVRERVGAFQVSALPLISRDGALHGVVCVSSAEAWFPTPTEQALQTILLLLVLALENLSLRERHARRGDLLAAVDAIAALPSGVDGWSDLFAALVRVGERSAGSGVWAIYATEPPEQEVRLAATSQPDASLPRRWDDAPVGPGAASGAGVREMEWPTPRPRAALAAPVVLDGRLVAIVLCLDEVTRAFPPAAHEAVACIASGVAAACRARHLAEVATTRTRPADLLWDLLCPASAKAANPGARATRLGCNVSDPRVVLVAEAPDRAGAERLVRRIADVERTALVDVTDGATVTALVQPATPGAIAGSGESLGVSRPCSEPGQYPEGLRQARQALDLGIRLWGPGRLTHYDELGSYRFVPTLLQHGLAADAEYGQVAALPEELLRTLDVYLDCGGNTAEAARQLYLHRNTLRQRLDRASTLLGFDLLVSSRWLSLHLAIKAARLSLSAPATRGPEVEVGRRPARRPTPGRSLATPLMLRGAARGATAPLPRLRALGA